MLGQILISNAYYGYGRTSLSSLLRKLGLKSAAMFDDVNVVIPATGIYHVRFEEDLTVNSKPITSFHVPWAMMGCMGEVIVQCNTGDVLRSKRNLMAHQVG